jgi:hypothetical protein
MTDACRCSAQCGRGCPSQKGALPASNPDRTLLCSATRLRQWKQLTVSVAIVGAALSLGPPAGATIVIGQGIGGVLLGMSPAQVRNALGVPARVVRARPYYAPQLEYLYPQYLVIFEGRRAVTSISTSSSAERTVTGVGVGSTHAVLDSKVANIRCNDARSGSCYLGGFLPGHVITQFDFSNGRVCQVFIGLVTS